MSRSSKQPTSSQMTNFVASLFLPQSLGFVQEVEPTLPEGIKSKSGQQQSLQSIPNLLDSFASKVPSNAVPTRQETPMLSPSPPSTPPMRVLSSDGIQKSKAANDNGLSSLSARLQRVSVDPKAALSKRNLTIPQSRAASPPEGALVTPRPPFMRAVSTTRPPEYVPGEGKKKENLSKRKSRVYVNPAYSEARYMTFDQDRGNGGLRNAVDAAFRSGRTKRPLWVGLPGKCRSTCFTCRHC